MKKRYFYLLIFLTISLVIYQQRSPRTHQSNINKGMLTAHVNGNQTKTFATLNKPLYSQPSINEQISAIADSRKKEREKYEQYAVIDSVVLLNLEIKKKSP